MYHDHTTINWPREWDEFRAEQRAYTECKKIDDGDSSFFVGIGAVCLFEVVGVLLGIAVWWGIWAVLPS